jgi:hypothetical protein
MNCKIKPRRPGRGMQKSREENFAFFHYIGWTYESQACVGGEK